MPKSKSLPLLLANLLFFKEWLKQFAPVALYKRATVSDSLRLLMTKEWWEQFAQVAHDKRATGAICESLFRSFAHKKRVNRLKNRWANSQPWFYTGNFFKKLSFDTMREFVYTVRKEMKCSRDSGIQQEKVCENRKSMKYCNSCIVWRTIPVGPCWPCGCWRRRRRGCSPGPPAAPPSPNQIVSPHNNKNI